MASSPASRTAVGVLWRVMMDVAIVWEEISDAMSLLCWDMVLVVEMRLRVCLFVEGWVWWKWSCMNQDEEKVSRILITPLYLRSSSDTLRPYIPIVQ